MDGSHQYGRRAVAANDAMIAQAEQLRDAQVLALQGLTAAGYSTRRATMLLKLTEQRLARLQASRRYLIEGESTEVAPPGA